MSELKTHRFFDGVTTTAASAEYKTDYRFHDIPQRHIQGILTSGAKVEMHTYVDQEDETVGFLVSTFDASTFSYVIDRPVAKIRFVMVSGGTATVEGLV